MTEKKEVKNKENKIHEPFFIVPSKVFGYGLNPYELSVLFYLCMRADNEKHSCWPSVTSISKECFISDAKVRRTIKSLAEKKVIEINRQYVHTKKGFNRQCSNNYKIKLFDNSDTPSVLHTPADSTVEGNSIYDIQAPPVQEIGEINTTIPNRTKTNITKSTELSLAEAEELMKERNFFLKLKEDCFEKLKGEYSLEGEYIMLLDRALEHLWNKKSIEYEGQKYSRDALQTLLSTKLPPSVLARSVENLAHSKEPVRSPVAYLAKCIFALLIKGEEPTTYKAEQDANGTQKAKGEASLFSLDVDDFFSTALRRTYGDAFED